MSRIINRDGIAHCRADQIIIGDGLDLEGDMYADPDVFANPDAESANPVFQFELAEVIGISFESHDTDPVIVLETTQGTFGFPVDYELEVGLFAASRTWQDCGAQLRGEGYNHVAGDNYAKVIGKRSMAHARIMHNDHGDHWIKYLD